MVIVCLKLVVFLKVQTTGKLKMVNVNVLNMLNFLQERFNAYVNMVMILHINVFHHQLVLKMNKSLLKVMHLLDIIMSHIRSSLIQQVLMII
jgi:uncharacterized protein YfkK (UPF0435 family)